ncbi:DUF4335 domain-containing protein [Oculatella sp. FACHB-28]|uniref:DUF4335 domain-containing protein n=1 Tax=Cyanophyceae TaxID=3028117 RepID=UPI001681F9D9|nr:MULTISPECIES: DUF4335 domain-containing protein [Cyanophyceae]MBD1871032.1 DUF4335 domain-containing protein [Cyanobacteria bacterium FACHB-471]MBD2056432.1 DUF4335 domain-containing protein [Oculatella sp. FACHB-28]MBD2070786.1 DUF4335 domain-containing protein [Leptolyngbya sp. FACHB-671]
MTIQRQYSLPNCKLVLEGWPDEAIASSTTGRPLVSKLVSAECHFTHLEKPLTGGREFFESLITAVSNYAQEFLSGVPHPSHATGKPNLVHLQRINQNQHRLTIQAESRNGSQAQSSATPIQLDLVTVQLFDLVEAIDQFFADSQTLPDLSLNLTPVSKRYVASQEPITKRAMPAALGVSGLAVAAIALFFVPVPQRGPVESETTTEQSTEVSPAANASVEEATESPPTATTASPEPVVADDASELSDSELSDSGAEPPDDVSETTEVGESLAAADLEALLDAAPEISDPDRLDEMTLQLRDQLDAAWTDRDAGLDEELIYRVGVAENGDILGVKQVNEAAITYFDLTPLADLRYNPIDADAPNQEPIGQFRVVFRPDGVIEVSPWNGRPAANASPLESLVSLLI